LIEFARCVVQMVDLKDLLGSVLSANLSRNDVTLPDSNIESQEVLYLAVFGYFLLSLQLFWLVVNWIVTEALTDNKN